MARDTMAERVMSSALSPVASPSGDAEQAAAIKIRGARAARRTREVVMVRASVHPACRARRREITALRATRLNDDAYSRDHLGSQSIHHAQRHLAPSIQNLAQSVRDER